MYYQKKKTHERSITTKLIILEFGILKRIYPNENSTIKFNAIQITFKKHRQSMFALAVPCNSVFHRYFKINEKPIQFTRWNNFILLKFAKFVEDGIFLKCKRIKTWFGTGVENSRVFILFYAILLAINIINKITKTKFCSFQIVLYEEEEEEKEEN